MKRCVMTGFVGGIVDMLHENRDYADDDPAVLARPDLFFEVTYGPRPSPAEPVEGAAVRRRRARNE